MGVEYQVEDGLAIITIARPQKRNAMDLEVFEGLGAAARRAGEDPEVRALVVRGEGGHLSSGIDVNLLGEQLAQGEVPESFIEGLQSSFDAFEDAPIPTVALVEGVCFGAGLQLAAACHLRVVLDGARLSVLEVRWGLVPDLGGTYRIPRLVGLGRASELVATGREVGPEEAVAIGLADRHVADPGEGLAFARELAAGPSSIGRALGLLRDNLGRDRPDALAAERRAQIACLTGDDFAEAVQARMEGREPSFAGR